MYEDCFDSLQLTATKELKNLWERIIDMNGSWLEKETKKGRCR